MSTTSFHFETFEGFSPFSDVGPYRAADYWRLSEGEPVELLRGRFIESPKRTVLHQTALAVIAVNLFQSARSSGGAALLGPMDCTLNDDIIAQPDALYIARSR
jgi:hypothetical protein